MSKHTSTIQREQIISAFVNQINNNRYNNFLEAIRAVEEELETKLANQDVRMLESVANLNIVRDFVSDPSGILGSVKTKHGEIAEQVEVGIRNARNVLEDKMKDASFDGIGRTAPDDYRIGDLFYQSKFIQKHQSALDSIIVHMEKYDEYRIGTKTRFHIPKDQHEVFKKILNGEDVDGLKRSTVEQLRVKILEIERMTGVDFLDKVEAGNSAYPEIQLGKVNETLNKHQSELEKRNKELKDSLKKDSQKKASDLESIKEPTLDEALKSGLIGAGVAATMKFTMSVYDKYKNENKSVYEYNYDDWTEIGIDVGKSAVKGGITGTGIYALTNFAMMPAPVAGGYVSATISGVASVKKYKAGEMDFEDLIVETETLCMEAGMAMTCALVGQAVIPIPILGAVVGSVAGAMISTPIINNLKKELNAEECKLLMEYQISRLEYVGNLAHEEKEHYDRIMNQLNKYNSIEKLVFDQKINTTIRLAKSVDLAEVHEVDPKIILRSVSDVDNLFM